MKRVGARPVSISLFLAALVWAAEAPAQMHGHGSAPPPPTLIVRTPTPTQVPAAIDSPRPPRSSRAETSTPGGGVFATRAAELTGEFKNAVTALATGRTYREIASLTLPEALSALAGAGVTGVDQSLVSTFVGVAGGALARGLNGRSAVGRAVAVVYGMSLAGTGGKPRFGSTEADTKVIMGFVDIVIAPAAGGGPPTAIAAAPPPPAATGSPAPPAAAASPAQPIVTLGPPPPPAPPGAGALPTASVAPTPVTVVVDTGTVDALVTASFGEVVSALRDALHEEPDDPPLFSVRNGLGNGVFEGLYGIKITPQRVTDGIAPGMVVGGGLVN